MLGAADGLALRPDHRDEREAVTAQIGHLGFRKAFPGLYARRIRSRLCGVLRCINPTQPWSERNARELEVQLATAQLEVSALHGTVLEDVKMREQWQKELEEYRAEVVTTEAHLARLRHATEALISRVGGHFAMPKSQREDDAKAKIMVMENEIAQLRVELQAARRVGDSLLRGLRTALSSELPSHARKRSENFRLLRQSRWRKRT